MSKWIMLMAALFAAPACLAVELDGLPTAVPEAEFIRARPDALGGNGWYLYPPVPKDKQEFGFPVRGYARGFENGQGCASAVGFWKTSAADTEKLILAIEAQLAANKMAKTATSNDALAQFDYWESPTVFASIDRIVKGDGQYAISVQLALKSCPDSADRFKARPMATAH